MIAMEVLTGEKAIVTVWLDGSRTDILKSFHCNGCGAILFKYYDTIKSIAPGAILEDTDNPRVLKCRGRTQATNILGLTFNTTCKMEYLIN